MSEAFDVVIVGGGHNALVAAAYLSRADLSVCVLEADDHLGGAAVSAEAFPGVPALLSRYSYLVSLLPDEIATELDVGVAMISRDVASYTPVRVGGADRGLLVERRAGRATADSFRAVTGSGDDYAAWQEFYGAVSVVARAVAPTFLQPLRPAAEIRAAVGGAAWERFVAQPLGTTIEQTFADDTVRGVVLTDGLIGTFTAADDLSCAANRCFLYHVVGNGTGEWRVPVGGMGAVTDGLLRAARRAGAVLRTGATVTSVSSDGVHAEVTYTVGEAERSVAAAYVLSGAAPHVLARLLGQSDPDPVEGAQLKVNMVLSRLPRLRSGDDPKVAFAGTFHVDEGYAGLEAAYRSAVKGSLPDPLPAEIYCHTLTDSSILAPELAASGAHTLTLFGLHAPARLFDEATNDERRSAALALAVAGLDSYLAEPLADCLLPDADGRPCIEAVTPLDLERSVRLPGGNIFHGELSWPWADGSERADAQPGCWGVETDLPNVFVCGAGARRGGGVSGIGGHNAAMAVLGRARRTGSAG